MDLVEFRLTPQTGNAVSRDSKTGSGQFPEPAETPGTTSGGQRLVSTPCFPRQRRKVVWRDHGSKSSRALGLSVWRPLVFGPGRRVLNSCRLIRTAIPALSDRTTTPDITNCSLVVPSSKTGQSIDALSLCPANTGLSVVKLSPELLRSMVRPLPDFTGTRRPDTVKPTSKVMANRILRRRSGLKPRGSRAACSLLRSTLPPMGQDWRPDLSPAGRAYRNGGRHDIFPLRTGGRHESSLPNTDSVAHFPRLRSAILSAGHVFDCPYPFLFCCIAGGAGCRAPGSNANQGIVWRTQCDHPKVRLSASAVGNEFGNAWQRRIHNQQMQWSQRFVVYDRDRIGRAASGPRLVARTNQDGAQPKHEPRIVIYNQDVLRSACHFCPYSEIAVSSKARRWPKLSSFVFNGP